MGHLTSWQALKLPLAPHDRKGDLDLPLIIAGTRDIQNERATAGRRPLMNPVITLGSLSIQCRKETLLDRDVMLVMVPIMAHGIDQKSTITAMKAWIENLRMIRSHHTIRRVDQTTSSGRTPM